jgi:chromosomal replication initiation ATPase DnaA
VENAAITLELAREAFGEPKDEDHPGPTIDEIIQVVCEYYDVKRTDLLGKRRHQSISLPRQVCMFTRPRAHPPLARGDRGHSSVGGTTPR